jgi:hypothetical protein
MTKATDDKVDAERARFAAEAEHARIADAAVDLVRRDETGAIRARTWVQELLSPATILWGCIVASGFVASWFAVTTRIAVLETTVATEISVLQRQLDAIEAQEQRDLAKVVAEHNRQIDVLRSDVNVANDRLWNDTNQLRQQLSFSASLASQPFRNTPPAANR